MPIDNLSIYLDEASAVNNTVSGKYVLLYAGPREKVKGFMKFWALYRPLSQIQVRYLNTMQGVTIEYSGEAIGYVKSRR
jgi:hypothetical protein